MDEEKEIAQNTEDLKIIKSYGMPTFVLAVVFAAGGGWYALGKVEAMAATTQVQTAANTTEIAVIKANQERNRQQLDRIEDKLDKLLDEQN